LRDDERRQMEAGYCSSGVSDHSVKPSQIFQSCEGSLSLRRRGGPISRPADGFGHVKFRLSNQTPKESSWIDWRNWEAKYLHSKKTEVSARIAQIWKKFFKKGAGFTSTWAVPGPLKTQSSSFETIRTKTPVLLLMGGDHCFRCFYGLKREDCGDRRKLLGPPSLVANDRRTAWRRRNGEVGHILRFR